MTEIDLETRIDLVIIELGTISKILANLNERLTRLEQGRG